MSNFLFTKTTISKLESVLSSDRFETYLILARRDHCEALSLYRDNIHISHRFYTILHIVEICLRNKIDCRLNSKFGCTWYENGAVSLISSQTKLLIESRQNDKRNNQNCGNLIASLPFGFWTSFFGRHFEELWRHELRFVFDGPKSLTRGYIATQLKDLRYIRNRIAHHECILKLNLKKVEEVSFELIDWLSPTALSWLKSELL